MKNLHTLKISAHAEIKGCFLFTDVFGVPMKFHSVFHLPTLIYAYVWIFNIKNKDT